MKRQTELAVLAGACALIVVTAGIVVPALADDLTADNVTAKQDATVYGKLLVTPPGDIAPTNNLELFYAFATNNTPTTDGSGNGNHGVVSSATWTASGIIDGAYDLPSTYGAIKTSNTFSTVCQNSFSICYWIKPDDGRPAGSQYPFGVRNVAQSSIMESWLDNTGDLLFFYRAGGKTAYYYTDTAVFSDGAAEWTHVAWVVTEDTSLELYIDGQLTSISLVGGYDAFSTVDMDSYSQDRDLPFGYLDPYTYYFEGLIDEVRIYSSALSSNQVYQVHDSANYSSSEPGEVEFMEGVRYTAPLGGVSMGIYTNVP